MQKVKWIGVFIAVILLATMIPANAADYQRPIKIQPQETDYEITDILNGATIIISNDPELPEGGIPPPWERRSFYYMTGMYEEVEGVNRLVGVWYNMWRWYDGEEHRANWTGLIAFEIVEGEYKGEYMFDNFILLTWWKSLFEPSLIPHCDTVGYYWNPNDNKLGYFHCFADYTEDDEHIRYVDRTFTENWDKSVPFLI